MAQNASATAFTAPGTLSVDFSNFPASTVIVQATGTGSRLTFNVTGLPCAGGTAVALPMYPLAAGVVGSPVVSASANGLWIIPVAGFVGASLALTAIGGGAETFSLSTSAAVWPF